MVSLVNSHTNATRIGWHLREIDLKFAPGLPPGRLSQSIWAHQFGCFGLFPALKLTDLYREPSMLTWKKSVIPE